jgi:hypothetical protein
LSCNHCGRGSGARCRNSRRGLGREDGGFVCNGGLGEEVVILERGEEIWSWLGLGMGNVVRVGLKRGTRILLCGCFPCGVERRPRMARCFREKIDYTDERN